MLDDASSVLEITCCRRLGPQSLVTDVAVKAKDSCFASANEDGHFTSTCM